MDILARPAAGPDRASFDVDFCNLPDRVRRDPHRVGLLPAQLWQEFLNMSAQLKSNFWVARVGTQSVARIGANVAATQPAHGYIGFFEADPAHEEAARALVRVAGEWLRQQGARTLYGPINFNTWFSYRFRVPPFDGRAFVWEPVNPPEYPEWFRREGFTEAEGYHSLCMESLDNFIDGTRDGLLKALQGGYRLRPFRTQDFLGTEVPILYRISMEVFRESLLFEPISFEMFRALYVPVAQKADLSMARFAVNPAGKEVGFFFTFRDGDSFILKTVAVLPEARGFGISNALAHDGALAARAQGATRATTALIRNGIQSETLNRKSAPLWEHHYALFKKELSQP